MACYFIGIDIGTTNIKSVIFDEKYNEILVASRKNTTINLSESFSEQNMTDVWLKTLETLQEVIQQSQVDPQQIKGIGVAGQGEGLWLVDKQGQPVRNAILWNDSRSAEIVNEIKKDLLLDQQIAQETGTAPIPCNTSMILAWMAKNEPESLDKAEYLFFSKDWVRFKLTGLAGLDMSDSGTSILNLATLTLSDTVFNALDINAYRRLFTPLHLSSDIFAPISDDIAKLTGLARDTVVCTGAVDVVAAALGIGAMNEGDVFAIVGTTCCTGGINAQVKSAHEGRRCIPHAVDGLYIDLTATLSGTPNIDWCLESIANTKDFAIIEQEISRIPAGSGGVIYHPYLVGERAPFYNENARASFFGINSTTTRSHLIRAVYEGVAFTIKDALEGYPQQGHLYLAGGGTNSACWNQIIADITGRTVLCSTATELSAKGAAILAGLATNVTSDLNTAKSHLFAFDKQFVPNPDSFALYEKLFEVYRLFRINAHPLWNLRAEAMKAITHL